MTHGFHLYIIHIARTRMIQCIIDGLSCGDLDKGLMGGASPLEFVALHKSALEQCRTFDPWLLSWMPNNTNILTPEGWFTDGHSSGSWIWAPPPAAADYALDQLCIAHHKDPSAFHVFVIPRLFTPQWQKQLIKIADYVYTFPLEFPIWDKYFHEPLIIGLVYPLYSR